MEFLPFRISSSEFNPHTDLYKDKFDKSRDRYSDAALYHSIVGYWHITAKEMKKQLKS